MIGETFHQEVRRHDPAWEYYQADLPNNPGRREARRLVLEALHLVEPGILKSLAETCLKPALLKPDVADDHDWRGALDRLRWDHVRQAGRMERSTGGIIFGNLKPLRDALACWAKDEPGKRWNLCDSEGEPLDWVADLAVQTLGFWQGCGQVPKNPLWENFDLHCYWSLDGEDASEMLTRELHYDAASGYVPIAPEQGMELLRLPYRSKRIAKKKYKLFGQKLRLTRMQRVSPRYFEWYAMQTFLGFKLREIRERELRTRRKEGIGIGVGDPANPDDLSAICHGIRKVAD